MTFIPQTDGPLLVQQLFLRHERAVRAFVYGLTRDIAATDDIVQETFLTVTAKASDYEPGTNFPAWACTIARLKVYESRRATRRLSDAACDALAAAHEPPPEPDDRLAAVLSCLEKLPARSRELIRLRYFAAEPPAAIARHLGRTPNGVRVALAKARAALRRCIDGQLDGARPDPRSSTA